MSRHWKQRYSQAAASAAGIHDHEGTEVVGRKDAQWIFYVRECGFTFTFFSIEMLKEYLDFYSRKTLPTSRFCGMSAFSNGPAASVGDGQSKFERLPGILRSGSKRGRIVRALERALSEFIELELRTCKGKPEGTPHQARTE